MAARVAVVGGGPAGLMAAETLATAGIAVTIYERMPSLGRKFLLAGRGGLNLTHSEPMEPFLACYGDAAPALQTAIAGFPPERLRAWCEGLGEETFVGTSGRVFPKNFKTSPLLRAWLARLSSLGVAVRLRHRWTGWTEDGALAFANAEGREEHARPDATILALGGASWPRLGADGAWKVPLGEAGVGIAPLRPANSGVEIAWSRVFVEKFAGEPLKRIALTASRRSVKGEAVVTAGGLEGGAVYALSGLVRNELAATGRASFLVDLRPDLEEADLADRLSRPRAGQSLSTFLRKAAGLSPVAIALVREASGNAPPADPPALARLIKAAALPVSGVRGLDRAISTAGGIRFDALDDSFMLRARPGVFAAGEMLDWEAPTGGYLLQASFATGFAAAQGVLGWLGARPPAQLSL